MKNRYPFVLPSLPYRYTALLPFIDEETIRVHHDTLFLGYVTRLNAALKAYPKFQSWSLEKLIVENDKLPATIRTTVYNNAGGVYNHTLYFDAMTPNQYQPSDYVKSYICMYFQSMKNFKNEMLSAGLRVFGSGWAWLVMDKQGKLKITTTKNQDTPLPKGEYPILPLDVWEHAYFLQYLSARNEYIEGWFHLINWDFVESRLCMKCRYL